MPSHSYSYLWEFSPQLINFFNVPKDPKFPSYPYHWSGGPGILMTDGKGSGEVKAWGNKENTSWNTWQSGSVKRTLTRELDTWVTQESVCFLSRKLVGHHLWNTCQKKLLDLSVTNCQVWDIPVIYCAIPQYIFQDNIHEINTWECPIQTLWVGYTKKLYAKYSISGVSLGE